MLVRVAATGLCRSDWHGWVGHDPDIRLPHVPGHEFAGTVVQVGDEVRDVRPGDRVTVPFVNACGDCDACHRGDQQVCEQQTQPGFTGWGSFAELVAVEHADVNVVHLPAGVSFDDGASLGCRFATAYRGVTVHGRPRTGDWVAVHGCGGVGLSAVMVAASLGANVVAVDVSPAALAMAVEVGAENVVEAGHADVPATVREITGGGAHVSIDALGSAVTAASSIRCLRSRGRHVQIGLLVGADAGAALPMAEVIAGELELYGSHGMAAHDYPPMLADVVTGRLRPGDLVRRHLALDEAPHALATMASQPALGVTLIHPSR
jgi:alcohol dehydrogenase